jgi:hypothetical protein
MTLFADEPHDHDLNYPVKIEGQKLNSSHWVPISEPITANEALDRTVEFHKKWHKLRFVKVLS